MNAETAQLPTPFPGNPGRNQGGRHPRVTRDGKARKTPVSPSANLGRHNHPGAKPLSLCDDYTKAEKELQEFDLRRQRKKEAFIALGNALREKGGWANVNLVRSQEPQGAIHNAKFVQPPIDLDALTGGDRIETILMDRRQLVEQLEAARNALPPRFRP